MTHQRDIQEYQLLVVNAVAGSQIGYRAIVTPAGDTVCNPSPMGESLAKQLSCAPAMFELFRRGLECGIFDDEPEYKKDVINTLQNAGEQGELIQEMSDEYRDDAPLRPKNNI